MRRWLPALGALIACLAWLMPTQVAAEGPHQAGLLVVYGDGRVSARCVSFAEDEIAGIELLRRSGLSLVTWGVAGTGEAVCKIADTGCEVPAESCFCQCMGASCAYWTYWYWQDSAWVYSSRGASLRRVTDGAIEAWVWGDGRTEPPHPSTASLCQANAPAEPTVTPSAPQARLSQEAYPEPDPGPPPDEPYPEPDAPTAIPEPDLPEPTTAPPSDETEVEPSPTAVEPITSTPMPEPSATPLPRGVTATPTGPLTATPAIPKATPTPTVDVDLIVPFIETAVAKSLETPQPEDEGGASTVGYLVFGLLALLLLGGIAFTLYRRRRGTPWADSEETVNDGPWPPPADD